MLRRHRTIEPMISSHDRVFLEQSSCSVFSPYFFFFFFKGPAPPRIPPSPPPPPSPVPLGPGGGGPPASYESAGKRRPAGTRQGSLWLRRVLIEVARAASRTKGSYFSAQYSRIAKRR